MAGIAAMVLAGMLGTAMGLNNTATFMASGVTFVAVSLWVDSRMSRRRRLARPPVPDAGQDAKLDVPLDISLALDTDPSKRDA